MKVSASGYGIELGDVQVGEEIELIVRARVKGVTEDLIDVTSLGSGSTSVVPGERSVDLLILRADHA